jgi:AraC-like DNA-binding protein
MMAKDDQQMAEFDSTLQLSNHRPRRRVRYAYPDVVIALIRRLACHLDARHISAVCDIPLSSVYRWMSSIGFPRGASVSAWDGVSLAELCDCSDDAGFRVPQAIKTICEQLPPASGQRVVSNEKPLRPVPVDLPRKMHRQTDEKCGASSNVDTRIEAARKKIEHDFFQKLDLQTLASVARMSPYHFIRMFAAKVGTSPHRYLMKTRINAAKRLLANSKQTIDVVAAATGFRSAACLNRSFNRVEGVSASAYCCVLGARPR